MISSLRVFWSKILYVFLISHRCYIFYRLIFLDSVTLIISGGGYKLWSFSCHFLSPITSLFKYIFSSQCSVLKYPHFFYHINRWKITVHSCCYWGKYWYCCSVDSECPWCSCAEVHAGSIQSWDDSWWLDLPRCRNIPGIKSSQFCI